MDRSNAYCTKYGLRPSQSPHVLVTTAYPDLAAPIGNDHVLALNGTSAEDIQTLLSKLADQLVVEGVRSDSTGLTGMVAGLAAEF